MQLGRHASTLSGAAGTWRQRDNPRCVGRLGFSGILHGCLALTLWAPMATAAARSADGEPRVMPADAGWRLGGAGPAPLDRGATIGAGRGERRAASLDAR